MAIFKPINIPDLLGVSPLCSVSPEDIWNKMVTPQVKALLGDVISTKVSIKETTDGDFPGDEVYNHNGHKIDGHDIKKVRYPYLQVTLKTTYGAFIIKYEGLKFKAIAWFGDMRKPQIIFKVALRDRRHDGTPRTNDTALIDFPGYDNPINATPKFPGAPDDFRFVEASIYAFMPGSRIVEACGDMELDRFVAQPFNFVDKPDTFLRLFWTAWKSSRSPGQNGNPIPDVSKNVVAAFDEIALKAGYDYIDNGASHYHVARWTEANGYRYTSAEHKATMEQFAAGIKRVRAELKAKGIELTRPQESWLCVLQSLPEDKIPPEFNFHGPKWIQDNIGPVNLWMHKPLSPRALAYELQRPALTAKYEAEQAALREAAAKAAAEPAPAPVSTEGQPKQ
ncbi:MAG: hypothetical protein JSS83_13280 [Cyanobacteria bacterium SZAS LIN-3]|nr:hypothetical protein [Cyanobacteria bacterium SZAS LIN-3]MBS2005503.1 hypothetical protein [Cyanobacteria bacterium SZAS TMP-1]